MESNSEAQKKNTVHARGLLPDPKAAAHETATVVRCTESSGQIIQLD